MEFDYANCHNNLYILAYRTIKFEKTKKSTAFVRDLKIPPSFFLMFCWRTLELSLQGFSSGAIYPRSANKHFW